MYAHIIDGTIEAVQGRLPKGANLDGLWIEPVTDDNAAACGWHAVVDTARPDDTSTDTHDRSVELVDGTPTVVWTSREWTPDELAARAAQANDATLRARVADALDANRSFLAVESPTNAQTLAQVKALTRQTQALIRLVTAQTADGVD
jgi:hypothetical protein